MAATTSTSTGTRQGIPNPLLAGDTDPFEDLAEDEDRRKRPWIPLLIALLVAILAVWFAGQTAARMWLEDLDSRLLDAGAGTNAELTLAERLHLSAYRAVAYADGFGVALERYDVDEIESRLTPVDANHGVPMIDIIDTDNRVVFAFRAEGAVRPVYRDRRGIDIVEQSLAGETDQYGSRFSAVLTTEEGPLVATAGPIRRDGEIVGALLLMTPVDEIISRASNVHGAALTLYSSDRGDGMATTTPIRPRALGTELRTDLAEPTNLPYAHRFKIAGKAQREQIGGFVLRHETAAFLGASLPDRSREVAQRVMLIAGIGMLIMSVLVGTVVWAWAREHYERILVVPPSEPLALPQTTGGRR